MAINQEIQDAINSIRSRSEAAFDDVFHGETYWSDDQLQTVLKKHSRTIRQSPLIPDFHPVAGVTEWRISNWTPFSNHASYDKIAVVRDTAGTLVVASDYTVDWDLHQVTITDLNLDEKDYFITYTAYFMNDAIGDVWAQKAAQRHDYIKTKAGQHTASFEQDYQHCVDMANYYRGRTIRTHNRRATKYAYQPTITLRP